MPTGVYGWLQVHHYRTGHRVRLQGLFNHVQPDLTDKRSRSHWHGATTHQFKHGAGLAPHDTIKEVTRMARIAQRSIRGTYLVALLACGLALLATPAVVRADDGCKIKCATCHCDNNVCTCTDCSLSCDAT